VTEETKVLKELEREDRRQTRREWVIVSAILVVGVVLAILVGRELTRADIGYRSIKCEQGDVILILEKANGQVERVECPAEVPIRK